MQNLRISDKLISGSIQIVPFSDKILYEDSDGDTIPDKDDPYPDEPFDERFEIVSNYNYEPIIDFVEERYKNSQECYARGTEGFDSTPYGRNLLGYLCAYTAMDNWSHSLDTLISVLMGYGYDMDFGPNPERLFDTMSMDHAADALLRYFNCLGQTLNYLEPETCEMLACSENNLDHLHRNITRAMNCSEQLLIDNATISFSSKSNSNFKAMCNVNRGADDGGFDCDIANDGNSTTHKFNIQYNYTHRDWWNTVGEAGAAVVAETTRSGNTYTMKYTYYVLDIYEWAFHYDREELSWIMHKFHEDGYAQEYLIKASFSGTITWKKGENAYMPNIRDQVKDTMEKWSHNDCWERCNEYERFFADIDKLPDKF